MTLSIDENILRLQISVDHPALVQILKSQYNFCCVEPSPIFREAAFALLLQMEEQFSTVHKLHDQIETRLVLEGILKPHNKWVVKLFQNFSLNYSN